MFKKKKKHTYENRLKYMKMLEEGYSIKYIHKHYGIDSTLLSCLWERYQAEGSSALIKKRNCHLTVEEKLEVISEYEEKHLSLSDIMLSHGVSRSAIEGWCRRYAAGGEDALVDKPKGRPRKDMGRPKKKKPEEMTELERLRYENERLRAENALLKKVKALVEEREARLKGTGRKPSKD
jgi:transposase-like protein